MSAPQYTAAQVIEGITAALKAEDVEAVGSLLALLATIDAEEAQAVYDMLQLGITFAREGLL